MAELNKVAARPAVVTIKGKEYKLSVLTIDDLADFEKKVSRKRKRCFEGNPERVRRPERLD